MKRLIVFLFSLVCALALIQTSTGCSGGVDLPSLRPPDSEAITTCGDGECDSEQDPSIDVEESSPDIYENTLCSIDERPEQPKPSDGVNRNDNILTHVSTSLCGRDISPTAQLATHEAALPFHNVIHCDDGEVPFNNPHPSCSLTSDITSTYIDVPTHDFGVCILQLDGRGISSPFFVYQNNDATLTRYEVLRTCVERFSCELGTLSSAGVGLIEAATQTNPSSDDVTFIVLRAVDNYIVEATDMGNLANAVLLLDNVNLPVDEDIVDHNQQHVDSVIDFIEDNCVE